jgi:transposase
VRLVEEAQKDNLSEWAAINSVSEKIGCTKETLRRWVRQTQTDQGRRPGLTTDDKDRLLQLERENRELRKANEILKTASAFFAQAELDRKLK